LPPPFAIAGETFSGENPFSGENLLKKVLPQTPFQNFDSGLESSPDSYRETLQA
jgi:hypothetical protein